MKQLFFASFFLLSPLLLPAQSNTKIWTVEEVKTWYAGYKEYPYAWDGLLYQGSDSTVHYFMARVLATDSWMFIRVSKTALTLSDLKLYNRLSSSAPMGYYYVDPLHNFMKVRSVGIE